MRKLILISLIFNYFTTAYNQTIKGTILDLNTLRTVNYAVVYFSGTFAGTQSDHNGYFEIDISNNLSMPLTISALGYYSLTIEKPEPDKYYRIYLSPKVFELREVVVTGNASPKARRERKANLKIFREDFLGTTLNSQKCKIINEEDISFSYDPVNDTLKAFSLDPILVENRALGYKITFYLDKFEVCRKNDHMYFAGNISFREDLNTKPVQRQRYEKRRKNAYLGSRMQFFRSLWDNSLDSSGYSVLDTTYRKITCNKIVFQKDSLSKYLHYQGKLFISYFRKTPETAIFMIRDSVSFDKNGYFDALGIKWDGTMAKNRVADWLPYEYQITTKKP